MNNIKEDINNIKGDMNVKEEINNLNEHNTIVENSIQKAEKFEGFFGDIWAKIAAVNLTFSKKYGIIYM